MVARGSKEICGLLLGGCWLPQYTGDRIGVCCFCRFDEFDALLRTIETVVHFFRRYVGVQDLDLIWRLIGIRLLQ